MTVENLIKQLRALGIPNWVTARDLMAQAADALETAQAQAAVEPVLRVFLGTRGVEVTKDYGVMRFGEEFDVYTSPPTAFMDGFEGGKQEARDAAHDEIVQGYHINNPKRVYWDTLAQKWEDA